MDFSSSIASITTSLVSTDPAPRNLVPLLTVFTPDGNCASRYFLSGTVFDSTVSIVRPYVISSFASTDSFYQLCQYGQQSTPQYSPGVCPSGLSVASVLAYNVLGGISSAVQQVWLGRCCPSGFTVPTGASFCTKTASDPTPVFAGFTSTSFATYTTSGTTITSTYLGSFYFSCPISTSSYYSPYCRVATVTGASIIAAPVSVWWRSQDLSLFPQDYAASIASFVGIEFSSSTLTGPSPAQSSTTPSAGSSGLSAGAIAGIVIGAVIGAAFVILMVVLLLRLRKRRSTIEPLNYQNGPPTVQSRSPKPTSPAVRPPHPLSFHSQAPSQPTHMSSLSFSHELAAPAYDYGQSTQPGTPTQERERYSTTTAGLPSPIPQTNQEEWRRYLGYQNERSA